MVNCTYDDIRRIVATGLANGDITELITLADQEITDRGLDARGTTAKKTISMFLSAALVTMRSPAAASTGGMSGQRALGPLEWRKLAEQQILVTGDPPFKARNDTLPNE